MSEPWDELEANRGSPRSARIDASGAVEVDLAMPKRDARNTIFKPFTVSPYGSTASSNASTSDDCSDNSFSCHFEHIKYTVVKLLQERKWRLTLLGFILSFMVLVASLAGTAATSQGKSASTFYSLFDTPAPTQAPTVSLSATPSVTPTIKPSASPSSMPSIWVQPISDPFQLRLYWQSGYYWQESISEEWYCAECASCLDYTIQDGISASCTSSGDSTASCREGDLMWLLNCKDKTKDFRFEITKNLNSGDQIRVHNTSLCFSTVGNRFLELRPCDSFDSSQLWNPIVNLKKFELRPYDQRLLSTQEAMCLSQSHHPKEEEVVGLHSCEANIIETTNYWQEY